MVVPPDVLRRYVGTYEDVNGLNIHEFTVSLENGQLFLAFNGKGRVQMVPMSETTFSAHFPGTVQFVSDASGNVTHLLSMSAENTRRFDRGDERPAHECTAEIAGAWRKVRSQGDQLGSISRWNAFGWRYCR